MQDFEQAYSSAAGLYWIAFLLTGRSELSLEITIEALDSEDDPERFSSPSILARLRKRAVAKALASVRDELAFSARQTASQQCAEICMPPSTWALDPNTSKLQIEQALLAIDIFPRCALLLTVFEGLSLELASAFLNSDPSLALKGQMMALRDLTHHLARMQRCNWSAVMSPMHISGESHATPLWSESLDSI